jgi:membrane-bound lytic murein transglycosylase D
MISRRVRSISTFLVLLSISVFATEVLARTPKPLQTVSGKEIPFSDTRQRLKDVLHRLGEPTWTPRELNRLSRTVHSYLRAFTGRQYDKILEALQRGDRYRPMIRARLKGSGIPMEFEALPMAESAYRYDAHSRAGARGLWQYMPASARHYGLHVGRKLDQRADPELSTIAAIKYLKFLNRKFKKVSVLLAVAAYNAGEGRIAKVVRKSGVKSGRRGYSRVVRFLPKETRGYVPEFLAAALILKNPDYFGFPVQQGRTHQYVQIRDALTVKKIAQISQLSLKEIYQLNPELQKSRLLPTHNFIVRLPSNAAARLNKKLAKTTLWKAVADPISLAAVKRKPQIIARKKKGATSKRHIIYEVRKGNNLSGIAKLFNVAVSKLRRDNNFKNSKLHIGQSLVIPTKKILGKKVYRVRSGDSLGRIAQRVGVSIQHLKIVNGVTNPKRLKLGQKLVYYA